MLMGLVENIKKTRVIFRSPVTIQKENPTLNKKIIRLSVSVKPFLLS